MGCDCGKPKCDGHCGVSPAVLQINNPSECVLFHRVEVPASMGDSKTNPPKSGAYKNVLLYYEADQTSWLYSSDGIPQKLVNGLTDYEAAINLPQINGVTLLGNKTSSQLGIGDLFYINVTNVDFSEGTFTADKTYAEILEAYNAGKLPIVIVKEEDSSHRYNGIYMLHSYGVNDESDGFNFVYIDATGSEGRVDAGSWVIHIGNGYSRASESYGSVEIDNALNQYSNHAVSNSAVSNALLSRAVVFDTVADMKQATNLVDGSYARTLGFHTINDGGGAIYYITDSGTANEMDVIAVGDLYASLIRPKTVNPEIYGAYGDGIHDDKAYIQRALDVIHNGGEIYLTKTYLLDTALDISGYKNIKITGNGVATLKKENGNYTNSIFGDGAENIKISNLIFNGDRAVSFAYTWPNLMNAAIITRYGKDNTIENCIIKNHWYGVCLSTSANSCNTHIDKCVFENCNTDIDLYGKPIVSITNNSSNGCTQNSIIIEPVGSAHETTFDYTEETDLDSLSVNNVITGNSITNCNGIAININSGSINTIISNNTIANCKKGIYLYHLNCKSIIVSNNIISNITELRASENGRPYYAEGTGISICRSLYGVTVTGNIISHARCGLVIIGSSGEPAKDYSVLNNTIEYCLTSAISLYYASSCLINGNTFKNNCYATDGTDAYYWYQNGGVHLYHASDIFCSNNLALDTSDAKARQSACVYIGEGSTDIAINACSSLNTRYTPVYPNNANLKANTATMTSPFTQIQNAG